MTHPDTPTELLSLHRLHTEDLDPIVSVIVKGELRERSVDDHLMFVVHLLQVRSSSPVHVHETGFRSRLQGLYTHLLGNLIE